MRVVRGYRDVAVEARGAVLAVGNFDGVHRGHQALLADVRRVAAAAQAPHGVLMFDPHPRRHFQPSVPLFELTPLEAKLQLLAGYGASVAVVLPFDAALARLEAATFIDEVLVGGLGVRHVVVGYDFHFGKGRAGTAATLQAAAATGRFGVTVVEPVKADVAQETHVVSSSAVRTALGRGAVEAAAQLLGHWWRVGGIVTGGAKRGTGMGYPTANLTLPAGCGLAHGIYAARVHVEGHCHAGAAYLGTRPTFDNGQPVLETFLLDFDGDLYGKVLEIEFIARLRGDQAFAGMAELVAQMDIDVAAARRRLAAVSINDPHRWPAGQR